MVRFTKLFSRSLLELLIGKKKIVDEWGREYDYKGEIDKKGKACGYGESTLVNSDQTYKGTFLNDMKHGLGKAFDHELMI